MEPLGLEKHMSYKVVRLTLAVLLGALFVAPAFPQVQDLPADTKDQKPLDPKEQKKLDDAEKKKQAEEKKKEEQAKKEEEKKKKKMPKNSDVENIGSRDINKGSVNFTSLDKEIAMGKQLSAQVEQQVKLVDDPVITEYVNRVGQNLVRNSDAKVPFTIKVVDSDEVNAFALPGGFFYLNTGVILAADDESEMAAVMAHEIAHVAARHATEQQAKATILNIATIPAIFVGGPAGLAVRQGLGFGGALGFLHFSRGQESEADYLGVQYLWKTGYDPGAAVSFFEKLQAKEKAKPGTMNAMFRDHPPTGDRVQHTKETIETVLPDRDEYVVTTSEFQKVKSLVVQMEDHGTQEKQQDRAPSLRRRSPGSRPSSGGAGVDPDDNDKSTKPDDSDSTSTDDRPTLKRRN
jgi:predicted Zn-dependent protease